MSPSRQIPPIRLKLAIGQLPDLGLEVRHFAPNQILKRYGVTVQYRCVETTRSAMAHSLKQAAEATGKSKPTILRAIQSGKISGQKDEHGEWLIEPAELHRVYPPVTRNDTPTDTAERYVTPNETEVLRREVEILREMLVIREDEVNDLRERLDRESEERRKLTAVLTDQRAKPEPDPPPEAQPVPAAADLALPRRRFFGLLPPAKRSR